MTLCLRQETKGMSGSKNCLARIDLTGGTPVTLSAGRAMPFLPEKTGDTIFVVAEGLCVCEWTPGPDRRRVLDLLVPGDLYHAGAAMPLPALRMAALSDSELIKLQPGTPDHFAAPDCWSPDLASEIVRNTQLRQSVLVGLLSGLTVEERVAGLFIYLALRLSERPGDNRSGFQIPLKRKDIADCLVLNADTLSRVLTRFKADGLIHQLGRDKVFVKDWAGLLSRCPISHALLSTYAGP